MYDKLGRDVEEMDGELGQMPRPEPEKISEDGFRATETVFLSQQTWTLFLSQVEGRALMGVMWLYSNSERLDDAGVVDGLAGVNT